MSYYNFGAALRYARLTKKLSIRDFGKESNMGYAQIRNVEISDLEPVAEITNQYIRILGTTRDTLDRLARQNLDYLNTSMIGKMRRSRISRSLKTKHSDAQIVSTVGYLTSADENSRLIKELREVISHLTSVDRNLPLGIELLCLIKDRLMQKNADYN